MITQFIILLFIIVVAVIIWKWKPVRKPVKLQISPDRISNLLSENVLYYQRLSNNDKLLFEAKIIDFLQRVRIEGVGLTADDTDKVLVAASAIIPIFRLKHEWQYSNLTDVLLYPDTFNDSFQFQGAERNIMGMVGSGYMNGKMILSKHALRQGFTIQNDNSNTAIHEFVHLLDKSDGAVDGVPENLLAHQYTIPWIDLMHQQIEAIKRNESDINPYAATSKSEFFAVVSEYFFERPDLLKTKHPELYHYLDRIFDQKPLNS